MTISLEAYEFKGTDRFAVRGHLGSGTSGDVYKVYDGKLQAEVALKTLHKTDPVAIHRFKREFRSLSGVNHPNLVQLYELESDADRWFFTMELAEGADFVEYVRAASSTSPHETVLRVALKQLVEGLCTLHNAGMLHRDLKPSNIRVTPEGRVVLLDFGLVKELFGGGIYETLEGTEVAGTPAYMSPEQAAGLQVTPASDWYAVGAILYECLTGRIPFTGGFLKILTDKQRMDPVPPLELMPDLPEDLAHLAMKLQSREPSERPTGEQVLARLGGDVDQIARQTASSSTTLGAPYVGREAHLQRLSDSFQTVRQGHTAVVYVEGGSGMGKSALVRRFLNLVRQDHEDAVLLSGRCYERESVPYKALDELIDALSRYLRQIPNHEVEILMPTNVLALARLFPALRRVQAVAGAHRRVLGIPDSREQRRRAFTALRELLGRLAQRHPLVLFIDDLQWGDVDSGALLTEILRPPDPPPLLLIGTFSSEERDTSPLLEILLSMDLGGPQVRELLVQELSPAEARQLVLDLLGDATGSAQTLADAIARESGGNPFFIDELVRLARAEAGLDRHGGKSVSVEVERALASHMSLEHMIDARLKRLAPEARHLLEVVAVAGRPVDLEVARQAAELGREMQAAIASLRGASLARIRGGRQREEIEAYHNRIGESVTRTMHASARQQLHHRLAIALEGSGKGDPETLAHHFHEAGEVALAAKFASEAAGQAIEALAFDRAARLYRIALGLEAFSGEEERQLYVKLGESLANAGRGAEAARALLLGTAGAKAAEALELRRQAAEQLLISGHIDEGLEAVRAVLEPIGMSLGKTSRQTLFSLARRLLQLKLRGLKFKERDTSQIAAEELIRVDTCWSVSIGLGMVDTIRGMDFGKRHLLLALQVGEPYRVARALAIEAAYSSTGGNKTTARTAELVRESMTLAERVNHPHALGLANMNAGVVAYLEGRWKQALELLDRSEVILRENCTGVNWELDTAMSFQLRALIQTGDLHEIRLRLPGYLKDVRDKGDLYAEVNLRSRATWVIHLADDQPSLARRELEEAVKLWSQRGFHIQHYWHLTGKVETALYEGDALGAWRLLEQTWPKVEKSLLLRIQYTRTEGRHLRCRAALAAVTVLGMDSVEGKKLLKLIDGELKTIDGEKIFWAVPLVQLVRAGVAMLRRDAAKAEELLIAAAAGFSSAGTELYAAVARRRRGEVMGKGGEGFVVEAETWMAEQGVRNVERMTAVLAPGNWRLSA